MTCGSISNSIRLPLGHVYIRAFQIPLILHLAGTYWFLPIFKEGLHLWFTRSQWSVILIFLSLLLRTSYCMQLCLLYSNLLFTERTKDLLIVFKYHVLAKSWLKYDFSEMRLGHSMLFPNTTTDSGCLKIKIEILYLYC